MLLRQMLQQAKDEGLTIIVRHAKILFCGAAKAGKTSFSRLLRNEEHEKIYRSTPTAEAQQVLISDKVNVVGTNWVCLDSKLETQHITNRLISKLQCKKVTDNTETLVSSDPSTNSDVLVSNTNMPTDDIQATNVESVDNGSNLELQHFASETSNYPLPHGASKHKLEFFDKEEQGELPGDKATASKQISIEKQMLAYTENVNAPISELENIPETWDLFTLLDTGGQPEFINMLPAINSSTAITFVVLNMSEGRDCLNNLVTAQYECKGYNYDNHDVKYANIHLLKCLLSSIKISALKKDYFLPEIVKQITEDRHPKPVVCIIGTCLDVLRSKFSEKYVDEILDINDEVKRLIETIEDKNVLLFWSKRHNRKTNYIIPVDNTIPREVENEDHKPETAETAETIQKIRNLSNEILKQKAQYEIPISWFILELELRNHNKVCIPLDEVEVICNRIMPSHRKMSILEIKEVLKFYHSYGMLLYFSEVVGMNKYVITNPQWLFLNLTRIIMCKFMDRVCFSYLIEEMEKGICSMELLRKLELDLNGIELDAFINLLMHLKVIAPLKTVEDSYFVPHILPPFDEKCVFAESECGKPVAFGLDRQYIHPEVEPLLIQFIFGTVPRGLFGSLIVQLLQDNTETYELCENDRMLYQYADLISFFIKPCWHISLYDRIFFLELQVRVTGKEPSRHYEIQTTVTEALKKVCNEFNWQFSDCRYGFYCHKHKEYSQDEHLALLETNPPYKNDDIPKSACCKWQRTYLNEAHTIWFKVC